MTYDIYSMMLLLRDTTFRCEREEKVNFFCHDDDDHRNTPAHFIITMLSERVFFKTVFFQKRCQVEAEVRYLRDAISQLKVSISTITKGVSMSKIEVNIVSYVD